MTATGSTNLIATRRALHGVAELVLAGPQYGPAGRSGYGPPPAASAP
ncbi:hypothetical protein ACTXG6_06095 [Pseudonocardia sp. Cha107L01]